MVVAVEAAETVEHANARCGQNVVHLGRLSLGKCEQTAVGLGEVEAKLWLDDLAGLSEVNAELCGLGNRVGCLRG